MIKKSQKKVVRKEDKTSKNRVLIKIFLALFVFLVCVVYFGNKTTGLYLEHPFSSLDILIMTFLTILSASLIAWCVNDWKKVILISLFWLCFSGVVIALLGEPLEPLVICFWAVLISNALLYKVSNKMALKILVVIFLIGFCFSKRICRTYDHTYGGPNYTHAEEILNCSVYTFGIKIGEKETKTGDGYHCTAFKDCDRFERKENKE